MSVAMQAIDDLFATAAVDTLAAELAAATADGKEWGWLSNGETFVVAYRNLGREVVAGNSGGWRTVRVPEQGVGEVSQVWLTAAEAVASLEKQEPQP